jgi:hypothetical protein
MLTACDAYETAPLISSIWTRENAQVLDIPRNNNTAHVPSASG